MACDVEGFVQTPPTKQLIVVAAVVEQKSCTRRLSARFSLSFTSSFFCARVFSFPTVLQARVLGMILLQELV